ncbi:BLUF domain-containing protein [Brevundimonas intermedia]|uniref:BLUF domain-containing protein n=1 Tax=Brevundimonas intermedia TaxID=74315 RepID=A0A4Y9RZC7_9CAUL|nr:BLUF domain-containing protein [Brevundimonas intermedia]TFW14607.1 BLUF domain-containing protein [Brevundimonas intermedia]
MALFRIVYVSEATGSVGSGLMPLIDIIGVSEQNNRRDHLTGVLMRHDGRFLQVLEGARADLNRVMARLSRDRRHENLRIVSDQSVPERLFPNWAMARLETTPEAEAFMASDLMQHDAAAHADRVLAGLVEGMADAV